MTPRPLLVVLLAVAASACGSPRAGLPDYSEWMQAGVEPRAEADAITTLLMRAGYDVRSRIETDAWVALYARRGEERAIRVVTSRGAALVLDSHEPDHVRIRHGLVELIPPPRAPSHDLDGDGLDEVVVGARHEGRVCLLPFRIDATGGVAPVPPDLGELADAELCIESFRDVDDNGRIEGIAVLRLAELARDAVPQVEVPLELDERYVFRSGPPPVRWLDAQRRAREGELAEAVRDVDPERVYRVAIELAALARVSGGDREAQLAAFDRAIARVVLTEGLAHDVRAVREWIAQGWGR